MARSTQPWTDAWVAGLKHPVAGEPEKVYADPSLSRHRLVVKRTRKLFEIQAQRPAKFGPRKTFVVQVGDSIDTTLEEARERAAAVLADIRAGKDPHAKPAENAGTEATLGAAWADFKARTDLRPRTLEMYAGHYKRNLAKWADTPLQTLLMNPRMARDEHVTITRESGPSEANHAMRLLRTIYRHASQLDTSLPRDRHPSSAVKFHKEKPREGAAIPAATMPAWRAAIEALRKESPIRASFHVLCLRLGTRPGELARARWSDVDLKRRVLTFPETKTLMVEIPIPEQAVVELKKLEDARALNNPGQDFVFPARGAEGHLKELKERKGLLAPYTGNSGRHTHHTLGVRLRIDDRILDPLEGRSLLKSGMAGRGYIDHHELGPELRVAQETINAEIDRLFASG